MRVTSLAHSNIALIKYWGRSDSSLRLPLNGSISMNLSNLQTVTTVEFSPEYKSDDVTIDGEKNEKEIKRVADHLNRIRLLAKSGLFAKIVSKNNFPSSSGLSSSASGFAALTLAASVSLGLKLDTRKVSVLARLASGSACRSIPGEFVEWRTSDNSEDSYAYTLFPQNHWKLLDIVAVVGSLKKSVPTSVAQENVFTSPFIKSRISLIAEKIKKLKNAVSQRDFFQFGEIVESEALELHAVIMTQTPSLIYFLPETVALFHQIRSWRKNGLIVYFAVNTGHDVHLFCLQKDQQIVLDKLNSLSYVKKTISNFPAGPAKIIDRHLF